MVQPRKTRPCLTERLLIERKEPIKKTATRKYNAFVEKQDFFLSKDMDAGFLGLLDVKGSEEKDELSVNRY